MITGCAADSHLHTGHIALHNDCTAACQLVHYVACEADAGRHDGHYDPLSDGLKVIMTDGAAAKQLGVINEQYPFKALQFLPQTLRLPFEEGIRMLQEDGLDVSPLAQAASCSQYQQPCSAPWSSSLLQMLSFPFCYIHLSQRPVVQQHSHPLLGLRSA